MLHSMQKKELAIWSHMFCLYPCLGNESHDDVEVFRACTCKHMISDFVYTTLFFVLIIPRDSVWLVKKDVPLYGALDIQVRLHSIIAFNLLLNHAAEKSFHSTLNRMKLAGRILMLHLPMKSSWLSHLPYKPLRSFFIFCSIKRGAGLYALFYFQEL